MDVSIIIPAYNRLWCLPSAIDSCRNNNCKTEIIVIDDGSTDGTNEWLHQQKDVVVIEQSNSGKCRAVNNGYSAAKGKYVRFLDSDDMLIHGAIDEQFEIAEKTNCDLVVSGYRLIDENHNILQEQPWVDCDDFISQQLGECDGSHYSAFLFKKSILMNISHRPDFAFRDDRMLILEVALKEPKIAIHHDFALLHRAHKNSRLQVTTGIQQTIQNFQHLNIYKQIFQRLALENKLNKRRKLAACNTLWHLSHWVAITHLDDAKKIYDWVYELAPDFRPTENLSLVRMYKVLGFVNTEKLLRFRRKLKFKWSSL